MHLSIRVTTGAWAVFGYCFFVVSATAQLNLLENGDFEDLTDWGAIGAPVENAPAGWRDGNPNRLNAVGQQSSGNAIGGSGTSAYLQADLGGLGGQKEIVQRLDSPTGPVYRLEFDFASEDPGGANDRSLSLSTRDGPTNALRTTFRINGDGDFQTFTSNAWQTLLPGAIVFDADVTVSPLVHRFDFTVDSNNSYFDLSITDSNGTVHSVSQSTMWRGAPPIGAGASSIEFNTFNSSGASLIDNLSLTNLGPEFFVTVNRGTGAVTLSNNGSPTTIVGYTLSSPMGGLNPLQWKSIAENYDVDGPNTSDGGAFIATVDPSNSWTELSDPNDPTELSESELFNLGASIGAGQMIDLGVGTWVRSPFEDDLEFELALSDGSTFAGTVQFEGNDGNPYPFGDLDLNGVVDENDFKNEFVPNYFDDTSALSLVGRYFAGDLDGDGTTGFYDYLLLNQAYMEANPGASALVFPTVPEPATWILGLVALAACGAARMRASQRLAMAFGLCACFAPIQASAQSNFLTNGDFEDVTDWLFAGTEAGTQPLGWRDTTDLNPATQQFGGAAIGETGVSAYMPGFGFDPGRYVMRQLIDVPTSPVFSVSYDFAAADPGGDTMRSLSSSILRPGGSTMITLRVVDENDDGTGDLQVFSGSWQTGVLPNSVLFSDVTSSPLVHNLTIKVDTSLPTPTYDITLVDSGGAVHTASSLSLFNNNPALYSGTGGIDFNTFLSDGDYLIDNVSVKNAIAPNALKLRVIRGTGDVFLANDTGQDISFDAYRIVSPSGSLNPTNGTGWLSLADSEFDGTPGNPVWTELGGSTTELAESYFGNIGTIVPNGASISLGTAYNINVGEEDLLFEIHITGAPPVALLGAVEYLDAVPGDYNSDGTVTAADYVLWRDTRGNTGAGLAADGDGNEVIDDNDYSYWRSRFGAGSGTGVALGESAMVPEPRLQLWLLLSLVGLGVFQYRRRAERSRNCSHSVV